jgi:60Kd inner membrane protein
MVSCLFLRFIVCSSNREWFIASNIPHCQTSVSHDHVPSPFVFFFVRVNNVPPLGWDDTLAFLILPVFLVISQFVSMELMQPKTQDPAQQQTNVILKVLPIMIGWFALNVPAALSVYWVVNNIVTTATSLIIRNTMKVEPIKTGGGGAAAAAAKPPPTIFAPPPQKPAGFGATSAASPKIPRDAVKPITAIDAEIMAPPKPAPAPAPVVQPAPAPAPVAEAAPAAVREESTYDNNNAVKEITSNAPESTSVYKKKRGKSSKKRKSN